MTRGGPSRVVIQYGCRSAAHHLTGDLAIGAVGVKCHHRVRARLEYIEFASEGRENVDDVKNSGQNRLVVGTLVRTSGLAARTPDSRPFSVICYSPTSCLP